MSYCIIIRAKKLTELVKNTIKKLTNETGYDVFVCVDALNHSFSCDETYNVIPLTSEFLERNHLLEKDNTAWLCGDYFYYAVYEHVKDYDFYWMIEDDIYLSYANYGDFFKKIDNEQYKSCDFISSYLRPATPDWYWMSFVHHFYKKDLYACFFPITRLSRKALEACFLERKALSRRFRESPVHEFPNDESFVATFLMKAGFTCCDLKDLLPCYSEDTLTYTRPRSRRVLESSSKTGKVYHPVLSGKAFRKKLSQMEMEGHITDDVRKSIKEDIYWESRKVPDVLPIVLVCGNESVTRTIMTIKSIVENVSDSSRIEFFVFFNDVDRSTRKIVEKILGTYKVVVSFLNAPSFAREENWEGDMINFIKNLSDYFSILQYILFVPEGAFFQDDILLLFDVDIQRKCIGLMKNDRGKGLFLCNVSRIRAVVKAGETGDKMFHDPERVYCIESGGLKSSPSKGGVVCFFNSVGTFHGAEKKSGEKPVWKEAYEHLAMSVMSELKEETARQLYASEWEMLEAV